MSRILGAVLALSLFCQTLVGSAVTAADVAPAGGSFLFAACRDSASTVSPLGPRPVAARRTLASPLPHRVRHRTVRHRPHRHRPVRHVVRRATHAHHPHRIVHRRAVPHRPAAAHRPLYRKVTYASPLCIDRAPVINTLLNDLGVPEFLPIAAPAEALPRQALAALPAGFGPPAGVVGDVVPPVPGAPNGGTPGAPGAPCCAVATPPVTSVPEPATWGLIVLGFGLLGLAVRRRRRERSPA